MVAQERTHAAFSAEVHLTLLLEKGTKIVNPRGRDSESSTSAGSPDERFIC